MRACVRACHSLHCKNEIITLTFTQVNCMIVSIHKRTVMNDRTSPRQIPVHIVMSLANKYSCNLVIAIIIKPPLPGSEKVKTSCA